MAYIFVSDVVLPKLLQTIFLENSKKITEIVFKTGLENKAKPQSVITSLHAEHRCVFRTLSNTEKELFEEIINNFQPLNDSNINYSLLVSLLGTLY